MNDFEPKIIVFCCNWCSYAGADLAGISRLKIKPYFRVIRTMCSGRVDPLFILKAFVSGADGVMITGCHPGDCHYLSGNYKTERRLTLLKNMLPQLGIEPERLNLEWISASEGTKFQSTVNEFTDAVTKLGPLHQN
jgi:coenzyme F420-reducing hydrogenase delta subunit